jgi:hypothetical protein
LNYKEFNLGADWSTGASSSSNNQVLWKYKANIGAFGGLELGFVGQNDREGVFINAKFYMISDNSKYPMKMAVGLDNLTSYSRTDIYMVTSKRFNPVMSGHLGFKANINDGGAHTSLMLGTEYFLNETTSWVSDLSGQGTSYLINTGVRYSFHPNGMISASLLNVGNQNISGEYPGLKLNLGLTWTDFL